MKNSSSFFLDEDILTDALEQLNVKNEFLHNATIEIEYKIEEIDECCEHEFGTHRQSGYEVCALSLEMRYEISIGVICIIKLDDKKMSEALSHTVFDKISDLIDEDVRTKDLGNWSDG